MVVGVLRGEDASSWTLKSTIKRKTLVVTMNDVKILNDLNKGILSYLLCQSIGSFNYFGQRWIRGDCDLWISLWWFVQLLSVVVLAKAAFTECVWRKQTIVYYWFIYNFVSGLIINQHCRTWHSITIFYRSVGLAPSYIIVQLAAPAPCFSFALWICSSPDCAAVFESSILSSIWSMCSCCSPTIWARSL